MKPRVMTITGPIKQETLGIVAFREHLFQKIPSRSNKSDIHPFSLSNLASIGADPRCSLENLHLSEDTAQDEIRCFLQSGGHTMLEVTPRGHEPDIISLRKLASTSRINIIRGTGVGSMYSDSDTNTDSDKLSNRFVTDLTLHQAGIIGEIILSSNHSILKCRVQASLKASRQTSAPILLVPSSPYDMNQVSEAISYIFSSSNSEGVSSSRLVIGGIYPYLHEAYVDRIEQDILRHGINLCIDVMGCERVSNNKSEAPIPSEEETARLFVRLVRVIIEETHTRQILFLRFSF